MAEPRVYQLYLPGSLKFLLGFQALAFIGIGVAFLSASLFTHNQKGPPPAIGLIFLGGFGFYLYWLLRLPYQITLSEDGKVEFIGVLRRWTLRAQEIQSIKPKGTMYAFLVVRTDQGSFKLFNQFDGFHDFLTRLESLNPTLELRGC